MGASNFNKKMIETNNIIIENIDSINLTKTIKSSYVVQIIFSFLDEHRKLNMIKYSKKYQESLEIDINYFKEKSVRFIVGDKNGKGKEYDVFFKNLMFEGNYKNWKRNGKGRERHFNGLTKYEGEYLYGERNGKGKEYDEYGNLLYEGEYLNGKRHGKGKEYELEKIKYEGEYLNGEKNGKRKRILS